MSENLSQTFIDKNSPREQKTVGNSVILNKFHALQVTFCCIYIPYSAYTSCIYILHLYPPHLLYLSRQSLSTFHSTKSTSLNSLQNALNPRRPLVDNPPTRLPYKISKDPIYKSHQNDLEIRHTCNPAPYHHGPICCPTLPCPAPPPRIQRGDRARMHIPYGRGDVL